MRESVFCDLNEASEVLSLLGNRGRRREEGGGWRCVVFSSSYIIEEFGVKSLAQSLKKKPKKKPWI